MKIDRNNTLGIFILFCVALLPITFFQDLFIQIFLLVIFSFFFLLINKSEKKYILILAFIISWIGSTKQLESDLEKNFQLWDSFSSIEVVELIKTNFKNIIYSSFFYITKNTIDNWDYVHCLINLIIYFALISSAYIFFDNKTYALSCSLIFIFYYQIFDNNNHLLRQQLCGALVIFACLRYKKLLFLCPGIHLTSIIFIFNPKGFNKGSLKKLLIFGVSLIIIRFFYNFDFVLDFFRDKTVTRVELENLGLKEYAILFVTLILCILNKRFLNSFGFIIISVAFVIFLYIDNSEIGLRMFKYIHLLVPFAVLCMIKVFSEKFKFDRNINILTSSSAVIFFGFHFLFKFFNDNTWTYFVI